MPRTTPESVFQIAQQAMERKDWETFFECMDRSVLLLLGKMGIAGAVDNDRGAYYDLCIESGVSPEALERVQALARVIRASAEAILQTPSDRENSQLSHEEQTQRSLRHRDLVKEFEKAMEACLKTVKDLAAFNARAERLKRELMGGGSVSSRLFVGDTLVDVTVEGKKAKGVRQLKGGWREPIAFVQKKGLWYINFLPKRGARPT